MPRRSSSHRPVRSAPERPRPPRKMGRISRELVEAGLKLKKSLGQNFLVNQGALQKIAQSVEAGPETLVLEIGCGLGNLTELLARKAGSVISIELDERFTAVHNRVLGPMKNVHVLYADFLEVDLSALLANHQDQGDIRLVGNIPYHITSPILFKLMASAVHLNAMFLLMQREVADRLCAKPGRKGHGILAVKVGSRYQPEKIFTVAPGSFLPPPKVHSALVRFTPREGGDLCPDPERREFFFRFVDAAFSQRRKQLGKSLAAGSKGLIERDRVNAALETLGYASDIRAENLGTESFLQLFDALEGPELPQIRKTYGP